MRNELERRVHAARGSLEQPVDVDECPRVSCRYLHAEKEEPDSGAEGLVRREPVLVHGEVGRREGNPPGPERLFDPVGRIAGIEEPRPKLGAGLCVELRP